MNVPTPGGSMPAVFVSHGSPTLPLDDIPARAFLGSLGTTLGKPRAVVAVSAHTIGRRTVVCSASRMKAVHDFRGFPEALYRLRYAPPGDPVLAGRVVSLLAGAGVDASGPLDADGLDHGIWVPLLLAYPDADIPVVVVSLDAGLDAAHHLAVGRALSPLRDEGVLVLASGAATHNLAEFFGGRPDPDAPVAPYAAAFADWVTGAVARGDLDALADWQRRAPNAQRAHPTPEHFVPLLVAAGAGNGEPGRALHESFAFGMLGMHAYAFG